MLKHRTINYYGKKRIPLEITLAKQYWQSEITDATAFRYIHEIAIERDRILHQIQKIKTDIHHNKHTELKDNKEETNYETALTLLEEQGFISIDQLLAMHINVSYQKGSVGKFILRLNQKLQRVNLQLRRESDLGSGEEIYIVVGL